MLSALLDISRVELRVQIYTIFSIPTPFFDKVPVKTLIIRELLLGEGAGYEGVGAAQAMVGQFSVQYFPPE